ncbi:glycine zipper 2TM domain-containing protein [Parvibaculum lavamentivorans]|uniref:glycine zipper 2TM domain-containing protein n=1 Tax=Parvibaculum lavamentivorans TaxID=256618 RepID=UPI000321D1AA|nr:glycine zipper 2TM domain-containing protein [Parvibaculum lavamentivorans]
MNHRQTYRPVYKDRPWYGHHYAKGHRPSHRGPVVIYRNSYHVVTIPQPVYIEPMPGYYDAPYGYYDSVYGYDDNYGGYGYRRSACNSDKVGAVIGAVLGGVIGAEQGRGAGPLVGGAVIGAVLGGVLGHAIDANNQACVGDVLEYVPSNQSVYWTDPGNGYGYGYEVTPMRTYEPYEGQYCREYQTIVTIGGRTEQAYGTACRQPDGAWKTVNS